MQQRLFKGAFQSKNNFTEEWIFIVNLCLVIQVKRKLIFWKTYGGQEFITLNNTPWKKKKKTLQSIRRVLATGGLGPSKKCVLNMDIYSNISNHNYDNFLFSSLATTQTGTFLSHHVASQLQAV